MSIGDSVIKPVRNAPSALVATSRFIVARLAHLLRGGRAANATPDFAACVERVVGNLSEQVEHFEWLDVAGDAIQWIEAKSRPIHGQAVTVLCDGMLFASRPLDVAFAGKVGLWYRHGSGGVRKIVGRASTFVTADEGALQFAAKPPGEFLNKQGDFDSAIARKGVSGRYRVAIICWRVDAKTALESAASLEPEWFGEALRRLDAPVLPPQGWHYLWRLGAGEIFKPEPGKPTQVCCHTDSDVGILQFPVDRPLREDSRISWSWLVQQLPSKLPEHIEPTHDYLSLAVEFDNGLDLTWMWSCELPIDTIFQCPLAWWKERETHWVIRNDKNEWGQWLSEERNILDDYLKAIGGPLPERIVGIWLIANTVFQRGEGKCQYREICLSDSDGDIKLESSN